MGDDRFISVSALGLGCSQVGSFGNPASDQRVRAVLRRALELGVTVFDTADIYGQGDSEREIGGLLMGRRDRGFVITKLGKRFSLKMRALIPFKPVLKPFIKPLLARRANMPVASGSAGRRDAEMREDFDPTRFPAALHGSLRRLRSDYVDALLLHNPPAAVCRDPAVWESLQQLKRAGKTRLFGVCCEDPSSLEAAAEMPGLGLLETPLDIFDGALQSGLAAKLAAQGVGLFVREVIRTQPGVAPQAAFANALTRSHLTCAIVTTSRVDHLEQLAKACR
jgi:aryl-alcohol dehydrogenase-like predicted oxidoreductase